jgi:DNA repair exonuclease SbcCD ATPase subunit
MKKITLISLTLVNFKGIKELTIPFKPDVSCLKGRNGTGKTTIADSFAWVLFGKDSSDRKDFNVKTLDGNNKAIERLDHEVSALIDVDGVKHTLRKCLREKWQKRRGSEDQEFTGNENLFWVDSIPQSAGEFQAFINSLMDEQVFKMVTNPLYFNSMKWEAMRAILVSMAGDVKDEEIAQLREEFVSLLADLKGVPFEQFRKSINEKKRKLKDELATFAPRIDEVNRQMPPVPDYAKLENEKAELEINLKLTEEKLTDALKLSQEILAKEQARQRKAYDLQDSLTRIEHSLKEQANAGVRESQSKINTLKGQVDMLAQDALNHASVIENNKQRIDFIAQTLVSLQAKFAEENGKTLTFDESKFVCPTCKRELEPGEVEAKKQSMTENFNLHKVDACKAINEEGQKLKAEMISLQEQSAKRAETLSQVNDQKVKLEEQISLLLATVKTPEPVVVEKDAEYIKIRQQLTELEGKAYTQPDTQELRVIKGGLSERLDSLKQQLSVKIRIEESKARIAELEKDMKVKGQELANLEKQEFTMAEFEKVKYEQVEEKVNGMFTGVKFKMFKQLINGGLEPTCETLIAGIPWSDANSAGCLNAGIKIINRLCEFYQVSAPIFADQAESTLEFEHTDSQLIKLTVSADHSVLTVE